VGHSLRAFAEAKTSVAALEPGTLHRCEFEALPVDQEMWFEESRLGFASGKLGGPLPFSSELLLLITGNITGRQRHSYTLALREQRR
jgi:hypothetical protein